MVGGGINEMVGQKLKSQSAATNAGILVSIPLQHLDPNPFQYRTEIDKKKLRELADSIRRSGLLEPVVVRRHPSKEGRFQLVFGHRRLAAFRLLLEDAKDETERKQWNAIRAEERSLDDEGMRRCVLTENLQRDDPTALEHAGALVEYMKSLNLDVDTVAKEMSMDSSRVRRLLRIHGAPDVIKRGISKGLMVPALAEDGTQKESEKGKPSAEHRRLDLMAALEFEKLWRHWVAENPKKAPERLEKAIGRALTEDWGLRRIASYVRDRIDRKPETEEETKEADRKSEKQAWKDSGTQIVVYKRRLAELDDDQWAQFLKSLEDARRAARGAGGSADQSQT